MKFLELILFLIIAFFVWNSLKRIFFNSFYKFPPQNPQNNQQQDFQKNKNSGKNSHGLNWDAEDAEFEEIKEEKS